MQSSSASSHSSSSDPSHSAASGSGRAPEIHDSLSGTRVYLRGVDLVKLVEKYLQGGFADLETPLVIESVELSTARQSIMTVRDETKVKSYQLEVGPGEVFSCIGYKVYDTDGRYGVFDPAQLQSFRCMFCLKKVGDSPEVLGIPIRRTVKGDQIYYHMVDIFCRMRCAYGEIRRRMGNPLYVHSVEYLAEIFTKSTGRDFSELRPSSDPRLLKILNGPMSWGEYHADTTNFSERPGNVYYVPVIEYVEQDPSPAKA